MNFKMFLFGFILFTGFSCKSESQVRSAKAESIMKDCLICIDRIEPHEQYAYINNDGDTIIPFGKYSICYTDTFCNLAIVTKSGVGFVGINRNEEVLFEVFPFDNGPDEPVEGLMRIINGEKIGYANTEGEIISAPRFDGAWSFSEGMAGVCSGCIKEQDGEYSYWTKGKWGFIDREGNLVIDYVYDSVVEGFIDGFATVFQNGKKFRINKDGKVVK